MIDLRAIRGDRGMIRRYLLATLEYIVKTSKNAPKFTTKNLDYKLPKILDAMVTGKGIVLVGDTGTGKSVLMEAILRLHEAQYEAPVRIKAEQMRACITSQEGFVISGNHLAPVLFIDDLGREPKKYMEYGQPVAPFEIIMQQREEIGGTLFMTTNLSLEEIADRYSDRVLSRLVEQVDFIEYNGEDLRYL